MQIDGLSGTLWVLPMELTYLLALPGKHTGDILEIGTYDGCLAALWAKRWPDRQVHSIDGFCAGYGTTAGHEETYRFNTKEFPNTSLFVGKSSVEIPKLKQQYGVIFIDGAHSTVIVESDANQAWSRLLPGGTIVFHDCDSQREAREGVYQFWRRVCPTLPLWHLPGTMLAIIKG